MDRIDAPWERSKHWGHAAVMDDIQYLRTIMNTYVDPWNELSYVDIWNQHADTAQGVRSIPCDNIRDAPLYTPLSSDLTKEWLGGKGLYFEDCGFDAY